MTRRVWITGIGIIAPCGIGLPAFRQALHGTRSPIRAIDRFDPSAFRSKVAGQVDDFEPDAFMDARAVRGLDRFSHFGVAAGRMALEDARLSPGAGGAADPERIGIYLGSALGGVAF